MYLGAKEETKLIRKGLKRLCPTLSVTMGKGTAYGWVDIKGSEKWGYFTDQEKQALRQIGLNFGANFAVISPDDKEYWMGKLALYMN